MRRGNASLWIACTALWAGGVIVLVSSPLQRPRRLASLPAVVSGRHAAPAGELATIVAPAAREPESAARPLPSVPAAPAGALDELERLLLGEPFDDATLVRTARALARGLAPDALAAALSSAFLAGDSSARLVAAAELVRAHRDVACTAPELPPHVLARLGAVARVEPGPLGESAARCVIALGPPGEAEAWAFALLDPSAELRERAARALAFARAPQAALALASVLAEVQDAPTRARAAASLARIAAGLDEKWRAELAAELALLADRTADAALLAQLAPRAGGEPGAILLDASQPAALRFDAAESIARAAAPLPPAQLAEALATLCSALAPDVPSTTRRRALYALGALAAPEAAADVALCARHDPDATVRAAALRALRTFEPQLRTTVLCAASTHEREPAVRAVVSSELARAARLTPRD